MSIQSIALPTAEKQDEILKMVKKYTGNQNLTPWYKEKMALTRCEYVPKTTAEVSFNIFVTDKEAGFYIAIDGNYVRLIDINDFSIIKVISLPYPHVSYGGGNVAFDGTNLFTTVKLSDTQAMFVVVNVITGVVTNKETYSTPANSYYGAWYVDRDTGYLYMFNSGQYKCMVYKDPVNTLTISENSDVLSLKINNFTASGIKVIGDSLYITGQKPNANIYFTIYRLNKYTLNVIASKVNNSASGYDLGSCTMYPSNDLSKMLVVFKNSPVALTFNLDTLEAVNMQDQKLFGNSALLTTYVYDGENTIHLVSRRNVSNTSDARYEAFVSTIDINLGLETSKIGFNYDNDYIDILNVYPSMKYPTYDIKNKVLYTLAKDSSERWYKCEFTIVYQPVYYIKATETEV